MPYAVVVDWYGPYSTVGAARAAIREEGFEEVLYLGIGALRRQKNASMQYVGITTGFTTRLNTKHKIREFIKEEGLSIYIGSVSSQAVSGRRARHQHKKFSVPVYLAESAMAFFLQLPLNSDKRCSPPKDGVVLLNRWWGVDMVTRKQRRPHPDWPDFIEYDDYSVTGSVAWHSGRRRRKYFSPETIKLTREKASEQIRASRERKGKQ